MAMSLKCPSKDFKDVEEKDMVQYHEEKLHPQMAFHLLDSSLSPLHNGNKISGLYHPEYDFQETMWWYLFHDLLQYVRLHISTRK